MALMPTTLRIDTTLQGNVLCLLNHGTLLMMMDAKPVPGVLLVGEQRYQPRKTK